VMHQGHAQKKATGCGSEPIHVLLNYSLDTGEWVSKTLLASSSFIRP